MKRSFALAAVLIVLIATPALAQSGMTLESLAARVEMLVTRQEYVLARIAALETALRFLIDKPLAPTETPIPPPTATLTPLPIDPEPTETATRRPTATLTRTPDSSKVTASRRPLLRSGPSNNHGVVVYVEAGDEFEVIGKNLPGSWIQVMFDGQIGWLPARYGEGISDIPVVATPTPKPRPTPTETPVPVPTATLETLSEEVWDYMIEFTKRDTVGIGRNPVNYTDDQYIEWTGMLAAKMQDAANNCDMDFMELAEIIDEQALLLEETGIPEKLDAAARWDFAKQLTGYWDERSEQSCERRIIGRRRWIVAYYADDE